MSFADAILKQTRPRKGIFQNFRETFFTFFIFIFFIIRPKEFTQVPMFLNYYQQTYRVTNREMYRQTNYQQNRRVKTQTTLRSPIGLLKGQISVLLLDWSPFNQASSRSKSNGTIVTKYATAITRGLAESLHENTNLCCPSFEAINISELESVTLVITYVGMYRSIGCTIKLQN